jgi:fumarate reductase subunit C
MSRRPYVRTVSPTRWYLAHPRYLRYLSREVTCFGIGALALALLVALRSLAGGPADWAAFRAALEGPWSAAGLTVILVLAVHNATSWFNVAPKAMPIQLGERFVPGVYVAAAHYLVWALASLLLLWLAGVG